MDLEKTPLKLFTNFFKRKKSELKCHIKVNSGDCLSANSIPASHERCMMSSLSVRDLTFNACPASPCASTMRHRDIDQDMETLRISRQDNPFLQVLASRESLAESLEELESDDVNLMTEQESDVDPLTLPDIHQHMVRSPPPVSWPRSPVFRFNSSQESLEKAVCLSPSPKCFQPLTIIQTDHEKGLTSPMKKSCVKKVDSH